MHKISFKINRKFTQPRAEVSERKIYKDRERERKKNKSLLENWIEKVDVQKKENNK